MKLTKKLETAILKTYNSYWENYLNGDVEAMHPLLADEYTQVGSAEGEVFSNKKDAVQFLYDTIDQVAGKLEMRNRKTTLEQQENAILIHEFCDLFALANGNWIFYSKFRASSFLQQKKDEWKFRHQHSSFPDTKAEDGQNIAIDKIAEENLQLREAVKRRTVELEQKNRELEIETALEKVRAVAMSMKKADDMLSVCKTISKQLGQLGVKEIRNVQTAIFYESRGTYMNYEYYAKHDKTFITDVDFKNHQIQSAFAKKMMKGPNEEVLEHLKGKKLQDWYAYQKTTNQFADKYLLKAHSVNYYWYSLGPVALGISTYYPLTKDETVLFKRFLKVFELAYRRYLDIEKATAQAKEAQIEASLEKVRAQALGMRKPEDLPNVCEVLFKELQVLGFPELRNAMVNIHNDDKRTFVNYDYSDEIGKSITPLFYDIHPVIKKQIKQIRSADDAFSETVFKGKELESWKAFRKSRGEKADKRINNSTALYYYFYSIGTGSIGISTFHAIGEEKQNLLKLFRNVFAFAYRRYMDVAQAEAQAREAQIELALERVRAGTMAMRQSAELGKLIFVLYQELTKLDAQLDRCFIMIVNPENRGITWWLAGKEGLLAENGFFIQMNQHLSHLMYLDCWQKRKKKWQYLFEGKEKRDWDKFGFNKTELVKLPEFIKQDMAGMKKIHLSGSSDTFGSLVTGSLEPLPEEHQEIISRFTIVFNQAYTRFLDLQNAEAQAREAQIEVALEKVRSRTMAMQKSAELGDVATVLFKELNQLVENLWTCGFVLCEKGKEEDEWWASTDNGFIPAFNLPNKGDITHENMYAAWLQGESYYAEVIEGEGLKKHYEWLMNMPYMKEMFEGMIAGGIPLPTWQKLHCAFFSQGYLVIITEQPCPEVQIFKRFAQVFDQTYTRFLDLQKAEAQAKEAQIEAALERVRSRSMGMQKSEELKEAIKTVYQQFIQLKINLDHAGFVVDYAPGGDWHFWIADEQDIPSKITHPYFESVWANQFDKAKEKGTNFFATYLNFEEKNKFYNELLSYVPGLPEASKDFYLNCPGLAASTVVLEDIGLYIENFSGIPYTDEENNTLMRFGKVFQQTYTRFLDLQKAEAQTREAQIELGLERVRARAMAMQTSDELSELVDTVFKELTKLDFALNWCIINIIDEPSLTNMVWAANPETNKPPESYLMKFEDYPFHHSMLKGYQERKPKHVYVIEGKEKTTYDNYLFNETEWRRVPKAAQDASRAMKRYVATFTFSNFGGLQTVGEEYLSEENLDLLTRFGKVFDLTYTRFNDLQKAEAQTREAQINLAVERVRARALAMYKSDEILELVFKLKQEMMDLDIPNVVAATIHLKEKDGNYTMWDLTAMEYSEGKLHQPMVVYYRLKEVDPNLFIKRMWDNTDPYFLVIQDEEDFKRTIQFLRDHDRKKEADESEAYLKNAGIKHAYHPTIPLHNGRMCIDLLEPPSDEIEQILTKMGAAFDLAYKRFEDLKNSEAQLREAQIEGALERVRSRSMAMHKSDELLEAGEILFVEMQKLGIESLTAGYVLFDKEEKNGLNYTPHPGTKKIMPVPVIIPHNETNPMQQVVENWKKGKPFSIVEMNDEETIKHQTFIAERSTNFPLSAAQLIAISPAKLFLHNFYFKEGYILIVGGIKLSAEQRDIMLRFAKVFQQTYTRFLDLQKAEAQTREAKIEMALERVRSRSLAMHSSKELGEVVTVVLNNLLELGYLIDQGAAAHLAIFSEGTKDFFQWTADPALPHPVRSFIPYTDLPILTEFWNARQKGHDFFAKVYSFEEKNTWFNFAFEHSDLKHIPGELKKLLLESETYAHSVAIEKNSAIIINSITGNQLSENQIDILRRFSKVFEQAYIRFLDLQKAEAQAREAKIEAALEKARSRTMGMQSSDELPEVANVLFLEVQALGIPAWSCGYNILGEDKKSAKCCMSSEGTLQTPFNLRLFGEASFDEMGDFLQSEKTMLVQELGDKALEEHYAYMKSFPDLKPTFDQIDELGLSLPTYQINHLCKFTQGFLLFITYEKVPEAHDIFKRFTKVFEQTYTRFLDLQKAEIQTRQAKIETALEKVRARALAMQLPEELIEVAEVLRYEMGLLGVEELETCSIYIHDEAINRTECWYALKDIRSEEKKLVSDHFPLNLYDTWVGKEMEKFYRSDAKQVSILMQGAHRKEWINYCEEKSIPFRGYYGTVIPDRTYHLYKFSHGAIGAASAGDISAESWDLLQRAASVFSLAYSRFKDLTQARFDLQRLKEEKQRAETALSELQTTQKQLIQSEKMASLGELTAGIAHEIQNPLNFVNNFSEVSKELLGEMKEAIEKGDAEEAKEIMNDVIQNLEKINHHGKRADGIVKGMLQHSRSSSNQKEATVINALADEYFRLAYHGLRAKDKSFNATMKTDFDETIDSINIIPQDIGRVILNLITNAFYVVVEKKKQQPEGYEPTVSLSTKKINGKVEIKVADNGNGIPQKILDKIFQPFFTTKPTGQGTGLGLSLSYDIIKAHGGELKVETKESEGSEFIISLPVNN